MVKKLFKYEWISGRRFIVPLSLVVLGLAVLGRLVYLFDPSEISFVPLSIVLSLSQGLVSFFNVLGVGALFIVSEIMLIIRFYRNIVGQEGYLTMTLPVTPGTHVLVKTVFSVIVSLWNVIVSVCALLILGIGTDVEMEILNELYYAASSIIERLGAVNFAFYIVEGFIALVALFFFQFSLLYACISVGQLLKKHRVLGAVLAYIAWYLFTQILGLIFTFSMFFLEGPIETLFDIIVQGPAFWLHASIVFFILLYAALSLAFFAISRHMLTKKLNLE